jgi:predicted acyl esterase
MPAIHLETDVSIVLRDGTATRANVWRSADGGRAPAILVRSPYTKEIEEISALCDPRRAVLAGFAVVSQDVRGRGRSGGVFTPFVQEPADGYDTVQAVAGMDWCSGEVVMCGTSYVGAAQWLAAATRPPALRAIAPAFTASRYDEGWTYRSGVLELAFITSWIAGALAEPSDLWLDEVERAYADREGVVTMAPWAKPWFDEPPGSAYWEQIAVESVSVPVLAISGWYDILLNATLRDFARDQNPRSRLVIGPWAHDDWMSHLVGERNLGSAGSADAFGFFDRQLSFYRAAIDGIDPDSPRVTAYVLGARRWLELESWPPPGAGLRELRLHGGGACGLDPRNPVKALGGRSLRVNVAGGRGWGQVDQRSVAARRDVVTLSTAPLRETTLLAGPVSVTLEAHTEDCDRADWACILCFEDADGAMLNLCEGLCRVQGGTSLVEVALGDVCVELPAGSTLHVLVAGASYPRWEPLPHPTRQAVTGSSLQVTVGPRASTG